MPEGETMSYFIQIHDRDKGWIDLSRDIERLPRAHTILNQFEKKYHHRGLRLMNSETDSPVVTVDRKSTSVPVWE